jgi:hypothetical protein
MTVGSKDKKTERASKELKRQTNPERAAHLGKKPGTNGAFCTECKTWYDSTNNAQVGKHAH